jgi:hypothetical protein
VTKSGLRSLRSSQRFEIVRFVRDDIETLNFLKIKKVSTGGNYLKFFVTFVFSVMENARRENHLGVFTLISSSPLKAHRQTYTFIVVGFEDLWSLKIRGFIRVEVLCEL